MSTLQFIEFQGVWNDSDCFCGVDLEGDFEAPVEELVRKHAQSTPNAPALKFGDQSLSYSELLTAAEALAGRLRARQVPPGARVAILSLPSAEMIVAVLAVLLNGSTYVPLDPSFSDSRIEAIAADAEIAFGFADPIGLARLSAVGLNVIGISGACDQMPEANCSTWIAATAAREMPAYVIYTSGSSGTPKGVAVGRGSLSRMTAARRMVYPGEARFVLVSPLAFDSSVAVIWGALTSGGCLIVAPEVARRDPENLLDLLAGSQATHFLCVPSLYQRLLAEVERRASVSLPFLKCIILAGESVSRQLQQRHHVGDLASAVLVNEYGPTETTVWATYARLTRDAPVLIGGPAPGVKLRVVSFPGQQDRNSDEGELLIGGAGVSDGYLNDSRRTAACFTRFGEDRSEIFYRSGDRVRWHGNRLEFLGRLDQQVKVRGQRVDLLELESRLKELNGIDEACAVQNLATGDLHVFLQTVIVLSEFSIRNRIRDALGDVHVPSSITALDSLPRTLAGKVDRLALREKAQNAGATEAIVIIPSPDRMPQKMEMPTALDHVTSSWEEVLGRRGVPLDVNFLDLGGHSLMVFRLQDVIERRTGHRIPTLELFRSSTIVDQARWLARSASRTGREKAPQISE